MIQMQRGGAWLPSQTRGLIWADQVVVESVKEEIRQAKADAVTELLTKLVGAIEESEVGPCVPWREVLRLSQEF